MPNTAILIVRIVQAALAIIVLGLSAATINGTENRFYSFYYNIDAYSVFCSVWTLLIVSYFIFCPIYFKVVAIPIAVLIIEIITNIFWFANWIALASLWGPGSCRGISWCQTGKASIAFACFTWLAFVGSTILISLSAVGYSKNNSFSTRDSTLVGGEFPQSSTGPVVAPVVEAPVVAPENIDLEANISNKERFTPEASQTEPIPPAGTGIDYDGAR